MTWQRLIRFEDESGHERFGDPCIDHADDLYPSLPKKELLAHVYDGGGPFELSKTGEKCVVKGLLRVLEPTDVPIIKCIGLNYMKHSKHTEFPS
jgi:hypothetical protein